MDTNKEEMEARVATEKTMGVSDQRGTEICEMVKHMMINSDSPWEVLIGLKNKLTDPGELVLAGCMVGRALE
jgi:hypothetical protein